MRSSVTVTLLLAASMLLIPVTGNHGGDGSHHQCDYDYDGRVSAEEQKRCDEATSGGGSDGDACDTNGDGKATQDEWEREGCYHWGWDGHEECDKNRDGKVDEAERREPGCETAGDGGTGSDSACDTNGDGQPSQDEWSQPGCEHWGGGNFDRCDANRDGKATRDEWSQEGCDYWGKNDYDQCDTNRDGQFSEEEKNQSDCQYLKEIKSDEECDRNGNGVADDDEWLQKGCNSYGQEDYGKCDFNRDGRTTQAERDDPDCDDSYLTDFERQRTDERRDETERARQEGRLGGEFEVDDRQEQEFETEDGVRIKVEPKPSDAAADMRFTFEADLDEGKTFVFDVPDGSLDGDEIKVEYFTVNAETGEREPASITRASSISDIMDPNDDEGPEFWIVQDSEGLHVLISIDGWSVHAVELKAEATTGESPFASIPGPSVTVLLLALAAAFMLARRQG